MKLRLYCEVVQPRQTRKVHGLRKKKANTKQKTKQTSKQAEKAATVMVTDAFLKRMYGFDNKPISYDCTDQWTGSHNLSNFFENHRKYNADIYCKFGEWLSLSFKHKITR